MMRAANDPLYLEFIARMRSTRVAAGYSQLELAERLGRPQSYVSKVETCERRIDPVEASRWCLVLGLQLQDVLPAGLKRLGAKAGERAGARKAKERRG